MQYLPERPTGLIDVLFLTRFQQGMASAWYRALQYLPLLEQSGIRCRVQALFSDTYVNRLFSTRRKSCREALKGYGKRLTYLARTDLSRFDLCYVQYEVFPYWPHCMDSVLALGRMPYVVDLDDAIYLAYKRIPFLRGKLDTIIRKARLVIAGSEVLREYAAALNAKVCVIPTVIDIGNYPAKTDYGRRGRFVVGWVGTPITAHRYLLPFARALQAVSRRYPITLCCVGTDPKFEVPGVEVENVLWNRDTVGQVIRTFDVGIMPLLDEPFARGKCGFKLIQYLGCGVPAVGSRVGANESIISDGVDGLLADSEAALADRICAFLESQTLREQLGRAGRIKVLEKYCLQSTHRQFRRELLMAAGRKESPARPFEFSGVARPRGST